MDAVAGWYADPEHPGQLRWWNGVNWTEHRAPVSTLTYAPPTPSSIPTPKQTPTRRFGSALLVGAVVSIVVAGMVFAAIAVVNETVSGARANSSVSSPQPLVAPPVPPPTMPSVDTPGMVGSFQTLSSGGTVTTESSEWTTELGQYSQERMDPRCAPVAFGAPVGGGTRDSVDPVQTLPNFLSQSAGTALSGAVQEFPTQADAINYTTQLHSLLSSCAGGFVDGDGTDTVTIDVVNYPTLATLAWTQVVKTSAKSYTVHSIDMRKGSTVAREYCYQLSGTTDPPEMCGQWSQEVVAVVNALEVR